MADLIIRQFSAGDTLAALKPLLEASDQEGFRFLRRLYDDFVSAANRFDRPGEGLLVAWLRDRPVGTCGLNRPSPMMTRPVGFAACMSIPLSAAGGLGARSLPPSWPRPGEPTAF